MDYEIHFYYILNSFLFYKIKNNEINDQELNKKQKDFFFELDLIDITVVKVYILFVLLDYDLTFSRFGKFFNRNPLEYGNSISISAFVFKSIRLCKNYIAALLDSHLIHYPSPLNLTYA